MHRSEPDRGSTFEQCLHVKRPETSTHWGQREMPPRDATYHTLVFLREDGGIFLLHGLLNSPLKGSNVE